MIVCEDGGVRVRTVDAGRLKLDGGAMFGVVPKPLWTRQIPADERNRIPLAMRCLLVETGGEVVLVDTGLGNKEDDKFREIYGIRNAGRPTRLEDSLREAGVEPEDVDLIICTHLHFDHAGGSTMLCDDGAIRPSFSRARHLVRRGEWEFAHEENERVRASYLPTSFAPLAEAGVLEFVDEDVEVVPGISVVRTPGHTPYHQSVIVRAGGHTVFYPADLAPTSAHLRLPWIMGYDVEPLVTLESKRTWLTRAGAEEWDIVLCHDPRVATGVARPREGGGCELTDVRCDGE
jgi:glyoxylase-like metal-dependent hydrolase (beta-lactamase superfamily II)